MAAQTENLQDLIDELPRFPDLELALYNSPGKGVIGGKIIDFMDLTDLGKNESWPVYFRFLKVEGPYHTQALQACEDDWRKCCRIFQLSLLIFQCLWALQENWNKILTK